MACRSSLSQPTFPFLFLLLPSFFSPCSLLTQSLVSPMVAGCRLSPTLCILPVGQDRFAPVWSHLGQQESLCLSCLGTSSDNNSGRKVPGQGTSNARCNVGLGDAGRAAREVPGCCLGKERGDCFLSFKKIYSFCQKKTQRNK